MAKKKEPTTVEVEPAVETIVPKSVVPFELVELEANSFKGIDSSKPIVIYFGEYMGKNFTILKGNQGTRKTSLVEYILYACGQSFDFKLSNFVNLQDNTIAGKFKFKSNNRTYMVNITKSKFELLKLFRDVDDPDGKPQWVPQESPKDLLKTLIGNVATSPMFLKEMNGKQQINWLFSVLKVPEDVKSEEEKLRLSLKEATSSRTTANKEFTRLQAALSENSLYTNWEQSERSYKEEKTVESVESKLNEAEQRRVKYLTNKNGIAQLKKEVKEQDNDIDLLEQRLELLKKAKATNERKIGAAEKYMEENKNVMEEYDKAMSEFKTVTNYNHIRGIWLTTKKQKQEMDEFQDMVVKLDAQKTLLAQEIKNVLSKVIPPIEGLDVVTEESIDQKREPGIYLYGKTPAQLSESELFTLNLQLLRSQGITMAVIENISSFGSETIQILNDLAAQGVKIIGTLQDNNQKDMAVVFKEKLILETKLG